VAEFPPFCFKGYSNRESAHSVASTTLVTLLSDAAIRGLVCQETRGQDKGCGQHCTHFLLFSFSTFSVSGNFHFDEVEFGTYNMRQGRDRRKCKIMLFEKKKFLILTSFNPDVSSKEGKQVLGFRYKIFTLWGVCTERASTNAVSM
jgi:hypothetical protein